VLGRTWKYSYDAALAQETRYTYDPAERLASVIDPRNNAIESSRLLFTLSGAREIPT